MCALTENKLDIFKYLVSVGARVDDVDKFFIRVLEDNNKLDFVKYFIEEFRANVNYVNDDGVTPLIVAVSEGESAEKHKNEGQVLDYVKVLVENGADVNYKCEDESTAVSIVRNKGYKKVLGYLIDNGADARFYEKVINKLRNFFEKG